MNNEQKGTLQRSEGNYKFYADDRARIKSRSMLPTETLRYIEALEEIAQAAYQVWKNVHPGNRQEREDVEALYDKLAVVNFMDETQ